MTKAHAETTSVTTGVITQVIGPVVDVQFEADVPEIFNALVIQKPDGTSLTLEVQQQLKNRTVRAVAMSSTDGLKRGMQVVNTGKGISVPVGTVTLGRMFNVLGDPIDGIPAPEAPVKYEIHFVGSR
jgi:F-type H+-transporting ATPase subunit beta